MHICNLLLLVIYDGDNADAVSNVVSYGGDRIDM